VIAMKEKSKPKFQDRFAQGLARNVTKLVDPHRKSCGRKYKK